MTDKIAALLRQALIGLEVQCYGVRTPAPEALDAVTALRTALAEQPAEQESVALLHDDGYWTAAKTDAGRRLSERLLFAGSPSIAVYTAPQPAIPPGYKLVPIQKLTANTSGVRIWTHERAHGIGEHE